MTAETNLVICATQRTGSTLIFDDFRAVAGCWPSDAEIIYGECIAKRPGRPFAEAWEIARERTRTQHLIISKVMYHYAPYIADAIRGGVGERRKGVYQFEPARLDIFYEFFRDAIWLLIEREDVVAQAVSMYLAETANLWEIRDPQTARRPADVVDEIVYDREILMQLVRKFLVERELWHKFFAHYGITPVRISYDEAVVNYPHYLDPLVAATGIIPIDPIPPRRMHKVGDKTSELLIARLREDASVDPYWAEKLRR